MIKKIQLWFLCWFGESRTFLAVGKDTTWPINPDYHLTPEALAITNMPFIKLTQLCYIINSAKQSIKPKLD